MDRLEQLLEDIGQRLSDKNVDLSEVEDALEGITHAIENTSPSEVSQLVKALKSLSFNISVEAPKVDIQYNAPKISPVFKVPESAVQVTVSPTPPTPIKVEVDAPQITMSPVFNVPETKTEVNVSSAPVNVNLPETQVQVNVSPTPIEVIMKELSPVFNVPDTKVMVIESTFKPLVLNIIRDKNTRLLDRIEVNLLK